MNEILYVFKTKNKNKVLNELSVFFNKGEIPKSERLNFVSLVCKYALSFYNISNVTIKFSKKYALNQADTFDDIITLSKEIFSENNQNQLFKEIIISIFHEANHIFIDKLQQKAVKDVDGKISFSISGQSYNLLSFAKEKQYGEYAENLIKEVLYFSSQKEINAHISSIKLALKFLDEIKSVSQNINKPFILNLENELKLTLDSYTSKINKAKIAKQSLYNKLIINKIVSDFQNEIIIEILLNKTVDPEKYSLFLNTINDGLYDEKKIKDYKSALLVSDLPKLNKALYYAQLINIYNYKIDLSDIRKSIQLFIDADIEDFSLIRSLLDIIDIDILKNEFKQVLKENKNERLS